MTSTDAADWRTSVIDPAAASTTTDALGMGGHAEELHHHEDPSAFSRRDGEDDDGGGALGVRMDDYSDSNLHIPPPIHPSPSAPSGRQKPPPVQHVMTNIPAPSSSPSPDLHSVPTAPSVSPASPQSSPSSPSFNANANAMNSSVNNSNATLHPNSDEAENHILDDDSDQPPLPIPLKPETLPLVSPPKTPMSPSPASPNAGEAVWNAPVVTTASLPPRPQAFVPRCIQTLETQPRRPVTSICVSEGKLYAGGRDGAIAEWDLSTGQLSRTLSPAHSKGVTCICISGNRIFSASEDGGVTIWNISTGHPIRTIRGHDGYVTAVCVSPEGRLYSGGADRMINEWDIQSGRRQWILTGHTRWVLTLCAANGRLYSGGNDHTVRVWDMSTGRCLMVLEEHRDWVFSLCLGRDLLYSSSRDGTVKVWDTGTGQCLRTLKGHDGAAVRAVTVAAGKLYSAGDDKAIVEWDVKLGRPTRTLGGHFGAVSALCAGSDGKLYSGSGDCSVKVWEIVPPMETHVRTPSAATTREATELPPVLPPRPPPLPERQPERRHTVADAIPPALDAIGHPHLPFAVPERRQTTLERHPRSSGYLGDSHHVPAAHPVPSSLYGNLAAVSSATTTAYTQPAGSSDDNEALREQLAKAQELLAKQNRLKFRLKSELTTTRTELAAARAELTTARTAAARAQELEEELGAAKELLVTYKVELNATQEAHLWALDYILRQSDTSFMDIELEVASMRHLLESPWTPLARDGEGIDGLQAFMPPKAVSRVWQFDSDWDSDVDVPEEATWWREGKELGGKKKKKRGGRWSAGGALLRRMGSTNSVRIDDGEEDEDFDEVSDELELDLEFGTGFKYIGDRPRPQSIVNRRLQATLDARRKARLEKEQQESQSAATGSGDMLSERFVSQNSVSLDDDDTVEDLFTSDDDTAPETALWTGVVRSKPKAAVAAEAVPPPPPAKDMPDRLSPQRRRSSRLVHEVETSSAEDENHPSIADPSESWAARNTVPERASWNAPVDGAIDDEASMALWTGPVRSEASGSRAASVATEQPAAPVVELTGLWTGPVRKKKTNANGSEVASSVATSRAANKPIVAPTVTAEPADDLDNLDAVVWNGAVKSSKGTVVLDASKESYQGSAAGSAPLPRPPSVSGGSVVSAASSRMRTVGGVGLRMGIGAAGLSSSPGGMSGVAGRIHTAHLANGEIAAERRNSPPKLEPYAVGTTPAATVTPPKSPATASGFGDHAKTAPVTVPVRSSTEVATVPQAASASSSWFRPLRSWVESIGEQLAPISPPAQPELSDRDRARKELKDRDELARTQLSEALGVELSGVTAVVKGKERRLSAAAGGGKEMDSSPPSPANTTDPDSTASPLSPASMSFSPPFSPLYDIPIIPAPSPPVTPPPSLTTPTRRRKMTISSPADYETSNSHQSVYPPAPAPSAALRRGRSMQELVESRTSLPTSESPISSAQKASAAPLTRAFTLPAPSPSVTVLSFNPFSFVASDKGDKSAATAQSAANPLERMATAFESVLEGAIEDPWSLVPAWLKSGK